MKAHDKKNSRRKKALDFLRSRGVINDYEYWATRRNQLWGNDTGRSLEYYAPVHALFKREGLARGKRFLHLGASFGVYSRYLQHNGVRAVALDLNNEYLLAARKIGNKRLVRADLNQKLPFKSNSFNFILSDHLLFSNYFGLHESLLLKEVRRILSPGGVVILSKLKSRPSDVAWWLGYAGFDIVDVLREKNYYTVVAKKNSK